jgi:predicted MFS family arabinose efflux permease
LDYSYGWLTGIAYSLPYSLMGLVVGTLTSKVNRKVALGASVIICGLS